MSHSYTYYRYACGIENGEKFVVTGGSNVKTVAEYSQSGFVKYLTPMNTARKGHACSKFVTEDGDTVSQFINHVKDYQHLIRL